MKWIGQHIYDLVARFRDDFYLEALETSTETDIVVIDSEGKVSKRAVSGLAVGTASVASSVVVTDSTVDANQPVVFNNEVGGLRDDTGAFTYNPNTGTLVTPNLTVTGTTTTINTTNLTVEDKNIVLNHHVSDDTSGTADGAGITIQDAVDASNDASLTWTAGDDTFEFSHAVEINNGTAGGTAALTIDNDDVDQIALDVDALNTTANVIDINAQALTTGGAIFIDANSLTSGSAIDIDIDDALTTSTGKKLVKIDYNKTGVTADGQNNATTGLNIGMVDAATNHSGSEVDHKGVVVEISAASNQGTIKQTGFSATLAGGDVHSGAIGYYSNTSGATGSSAVDFKAVSSANTNDFFAITTQANGLTEIVTADADAALAHLHFHADGNTWFHTADSHATSLGAVVGDGVGDSPYFEVSGHHTNSSRLRLYERGGASDTDYFEILTSTAGATTLATVDAAAAAAHFEVAADGNIILDAAGDIALESGGGDVTSDANIFAISSDAPSFRLQSKINNATAAAITFDKNQYLSGGEAGVADDDLLGTILWTGTDNAAQLVQYASIVASISEANNTDEAGRLEFKVAESNGTTTALTTGLKLEGEHATDGEIDVTIAAGSASTTTIAGTLTMGSTATINNSGVIQVALQPTIDHDSLANFVAAEHYDWSTNISGTATIETRNITDLHGAGVDGAANQLLTDDGDGTITSEANLTFTSSTLVVNKDGGTPVFSLKRAGTGGDNDIIGAMRFTGTTDADSLTRYVTLQGKILDASDATPQSQFTVNVFSDSTTEAFKLSGDNGSGRVDVNLAAGAASVTTTAGSLNINNGLGSLKALDNVGGATNIDYEFGNANNTGNINLLPHNPGGRTSAQLPNFGMGLHNLTPSGTDQAGKNLNFSSGMATGNAAPGRIFMTNYGQRGGSGTSINESDGVSHIFGYDQIDLFSASNNNSEARLIIHSLDSTAGNSGELQFKKDGFNPADTEDGEALGKITFYGEDEGANNTMFAYIIGNIAESDEGAEGGKLSLGVASHDAELRNGLVISDGNAEDEVDIDIASGAASVTTIAGTLTMGSTATLDNSGLLQVAGQTNITSLGTLTGLTVAGNVHAGAHDGSDKLYVNRFNGTFPYSHIQAGSTDENVKVGIKLDTRRNDGVAENALVIEGDTRAATFAGAVTVNGALAGTLATAAQTNITSLGTLTALTVDDITINGNTITSVADLNIVATGDDIIVDTDNFTISSATTVKPSFNLKSTVNSNKPAQMLFIKDRSLTAGQNGDNIGTTYYQAGNDAQEQTNFASIIGSVFKAADGAEEGKLSFFVKNTSSTQPTAALSLESNGAITDVKIGEGATSTTTITGLLTMGGTQTLNNTGQIQVASQPSITTLAGLTSFGAAGATTSIAAGDVTMYNAVNDGNPTISLGSSATNRFEIESIYNSGTQTLDEIAFQSYTTSGGTSDGRFKFYIDEVLTFKMADASVITYGNFLSDSSNGFIRSSNNAASSTTGGGKLILMADDGAAMADNHRLGTIEFQGAEDASNNRSIGARIDAVCRGDWTGSDNDADLEFYTTDGTTESKVLTLDASKNAQFTQHVEVGGRLELGHVSDTSLERSAAGTVTIEGNQIMTAGVTKGNIIHVDAPKYIALYLFYINQNNYWYTPPMYNSTLTTSATINGASISALSQARATNYIATRACKVKRVSVVFYLSSSYLNGDINLEWALVKWSPQNDSNSSTTFTQMTITDKDAGYTEAEVYCCTFDVTDNAASTLAEKDCIAMCVRTTSGASNGALVRVLTYGHMNYEIELQ